MVILLEMTFKILFFGAPLLLAGLAQGLCIKYSWLSRLKRPLDLGLMFRGRRIFGDHKTWRGLVINMVFCTLGTMIQTWLQNNDCISQWLLLLDYKKYGFLAGLLLGFGMTVGELPNSFVKRQLDIHPGKKGKGLLRMAFFIFDQVDLTIGIWIFFFFLIRPSLMLILWSFLLTILLHVIISSVGYLLGMRKSIV